MWLQIGDQVQNRSGWTGVVVDVDDTHATVDFDHGDRGARFARNGDGVLTLRDPNTVMTPSPDWSLDPDGKIPDVGSELESELSKLPPGDTPDYHRKHPLDTGPVKDGPVLDEDGNPWSNL